MYGYGYERLKQITHTKKGKAYVAQAEKYYQENYANKPILSLSFFQYKRFEIDGDRIGYESEYFERRNRLFLLQILALAKDKYLTELEDVVAAICDEYTWVLPAHARFTIDLFAAETGYYLSETLYVFKDKLSKELQKRIYHSVETKIIKAYEEQPHFGWEDYKNNWMAVCTGSIGVCYMYLFPERFEMVKERMFHALNEEFIQVAFHKDGFCTEGVTYWLYGFGFFCSFFHVYERIFNERPAFIDGEYIDKILGYYANARMQEGVYLPFADGGRRVLQLNIHELMQVKLLYGNSFTIPKMDIPFYGNKALGFSFLLGLNDLENKPTVEKETSIYYQEAQVFIRRRKNYAFTAKGGNNNELHNHNDVGSFQIVKNQKRYICDVGVCLYTKEVFDGGRYSVFNCNSLSHSVPIVDGKLQSAGAKYYGKVVGVDENAFTLDIANAYEGEGKEVLVAYETLENCVRANYACKGIEKEIVFHFASDIKPIIKDGVVYIKDMKIVCDKNVTPTISEKKYRTFGVRRLPENQKAYLIDYAVQGQNEITARFTFEW